MDRDAAPAEASAPGAVAPSAFSSSAAPLYTIPSSTIPPSAGLPSAAPLAGRRAPPSGGIVVFSGGSAANSLVDVFERVRDASRATLSYVLPVSDNGGSSSEIIRVFGSPGGLPPPRELPSSSKSRR